MATLTIHSSAGHQLNLGVFAIDFFIYLYIYETVNISSDQMIVGQSSPTYL